jgi:hypothetical protein
MQDVTVYLGRFVKPSGTERLSVLHGFVVSVPPGRRLVNIYDAFCLKYPKGLFWRILS